MISGLFDSQPAPSSRRTALRRIRGWMAEVFALPDDAHVTVNEVRCDDPDCPEVETVIAVLRAGGGSGRFKIPRAAADVTRADILALHHTGDAVPPHGA